MNEDTGTEVAEATVATDQEGDAAPQLSQTGEEQAVAEPDVRTLLEKVEGLEKGISAERRKRQYVESQLANLSENAKKPEAPDLPDEEFLTGKDVKEFLSKKDKETQEREFRRAYKDSLDGAVSKHADYYDVIALAEDMIQNDPEYAGMEAVILASAKGPMIAYNLGKLHPKYAQKISATERQKVAKTIQSNLEKPQTLTGVQGASSTTIDEVTRWKNASDAEFEAEKRRKLGLD